MSYGNKNSDENKQKTTFQARPENITDYDIHWAIRDIPYCILNLPKKGILKLFIDLIGNRKSIKISYEKLENPMGASERQLRNQFHELEEMDFLIIKKPEKYVKGSMNEYGLNYIKILSTAKEFREQNLG